MSVIQRLLFSAFFAPLWAGQPLHAAEFEVLDRLSVDGYSVLRGSADIPGGSFTVGGSTFVVKDGNVGIGTASPGAKLEISGNFKVGDNLIIGGSSSYKVYQNLASLDNYSGPAGAIVIDTSIPFSAANMFTITISGYSYGGTGPWEVAVAAYAGEGNIHSARYVSVNKAGFGAPVIARNSATGMVAVILGTTGGTWNYQMTVSKFTQGFNGQLESYADGWTITPRTSLASYDYQTTCSDGSTFTGLVQSTVSGTSYIAGGNFGIGTTNPAAILDVGGTGSIKIPVGTTAERPGSPVNGMLRLNVTTGRLEYYNGGWNSVGGIAASGGTITEAGGYRIHTFTVSGTFVPAGSGNVEYLVIAGGGGGGSSFGGGGGAGGYRTGTVAVTANTAVAVTVGAGGAGAAAVDSGYGTNGDNSVFSSITATGGGGGGAYIAALYGKAGGSGGGGGSSETNMTQAGGAGTSGQGYDGGYGYGRNGYLGGGGGGAGGLGGNAVASTKAGNGGPGLQSSISGTAVYYASGGGGASYLYSNGTTIGYASAGGGANGVGGNSEHGINATANTGGGGGGGGYPAGGGGNGGSGIVIVRYPI